MSVTPDKCEACGAVLDWKGRCGLCVRFERLRGEVARNGGFKADRRERRREHKLKPWNGHSGVENAVPNGDKE